MHAAAPGDRLAVTARARGAGAEHLTIVGPDGVLADGATAADLDAVHADLVLDGPTWIAAIARGDAHPNTLDTSVFAHTSPVHVEVDGVRATPVADARWCLAFLDRLEALVTAEGRFDPATRDAHLADHIALIDRARAVYRAVEATAPP